METTANPITDSKYQVNRLRMPHINKEDEELLIDYCAELGYILDIDRERGRYFISKDIKMTDIVYIQKDYWGKLWVVKSRYTPKEEWENLSENYYIMRKVRESFAFYIKYDKKVRRFYTKRFLPILGIIAFGNPFCFPELKTT